MKTFFAILITGLLISCSSSNEETGEEEMKTGSADIYFSSEKIRRAGIRFGKIEKKKMATEVNARGQLELFPASKAVISVLNGGIVRSIRVVPGQKVSQGSVLGTYSHPDFIALQEEYLQVKNDLALLEINYERQKKLKEKNINSEKEFMEVEANFRNKRTQFKSVKSQLDMIGINISELEQGKIFSEVPIKSPISGYLKEISVSLGEYVDIHKPLFTVINKDNLYLLLKVFEKDIHKISVGQRVSFKTTVNEEHEYNAVISEISGMVEETMRVIEVFAQITEPVEGALPGMFISSTIHADERETNALPESALLYESSEEVYGFYTLDDPAAEEVGFYKFYLTQGRSKANGFVEISGYSDIPSDARVVVEGAYYIKSELLKELE